MEFTELADYPLPAGRLTEWVPSVTGDTDPWVADDRPLTYLHEDYCSRGSTCHTVLDIATERGENHPGSWLGAIFEIPHRYDEQAVRRALTEWMRRHEVFRTTVAETIDEAGRTLSRRALAADLDVVPERVGFLRTGTRVHQHVLNLFERRLSPLAWPHCLVATLTDTHPESSQETFLLVFGADHSVMDAYSMLLAIGEIQRLYEQQVYGTDPRLPTIGSHVDFSVADRALGDELSVEHRAVDEWRGFLDRGAGAFPQFPLPISGPVTRRGNQSGTSSWLLSGEQADAINQRARRAGHTMQSAVLAALALTGRRLTGQDTMRFAMPVHTRNEPQYAESVGWYVGLLPIELDLAGARSVDDCLVAATEAVARRKDLGRYPYPRIAQIIGSASAPQFVVSYVDLRFVPDAAQWAQWGARTLRGGSDSDSEVYLWIVRSPKGISISARFPSNAVAAANVHRFISSFTSVLATLSDVTLDVTLLDSNELIVKAG